MWTEKSEKMFLEFYRWLYWDTSIATGTWELPTITKDEEEEHIRLWKEALTKCLWGKKKANSLYKMRPYGKQSWLDYAFGWLWLNYWPTVVDKFDDWDPTYKEEKFNR